MRTSPVWVSALAALLAAGPVVAGGGLVTIRVGEQDTCSIAGVTTLKWDEQARRSWIRFDLSKLGGKGDLQRAILRFWVDAVNPHGRPYKAWGYERFKDPRFAGFKVWAGREPRDESLLATRFCFNTPTYWRYEFDVTKAVRAWLADPAKNHGLCANFRFPVGIEGKPQAAWQRPYLAVTLVA